MKRGKGLRRDTPKARKFLERSKLMGIMRSKRLKVRGRLAAAKRKRDFGKKAVWVRTLPCVVCNRTPSDPHHEPFLAQGGKAKDLVPLCRFHHSFGPTSRHGSGSHEIFIKAYGIDLIAEAARIEAEWSDIL